MTPPGFPSRQGLYDPAHEHDACGVGFVADIRGRKSHTILRQALQVLNNLQHRGASGSEINTGDGAGILLQTPHEFLVAACRREQISLPGPREYGVGMVFLPRNRADRYKCEKLFEEIVDAEGQTVLGWRPVPTCNTGLGDWARQNEPIIRQVFIGRAPGLADDLAFERKLYIIRKLAEKGIRYSGIKGCEQFYIPSLSYKTLIYKGMLLPSQLEAYFPDLSDPALETALALVHSRFSTNTFPSWERAHPYRYVAHNGEINTLRGNVNWMLARQATLVSEVFGADLKKLFPIINEDGSDSAMFDNVLEFLVLAGRSLPQAMMMMVPEPWSGHEGMSDAKKAFYAYHACLMEPWDGPASMVFTDGIQIGATLDRNGLRPSRYYITKDHLVVLASEVGVLDVPAERVLHKGRLQPGHMFLLDTAQGRVIADAEIKATIAAEQPYRLWLNTHQITLAALPERAVPPSDPATLLPRQRAFGYTFEDLRLILAPMARDGAQPIGSMGTDTPLAVLSNQPQLLYNYFKQLFAQVTNPPIDAIREEIVTSTETVLGASGNLLQCVPENCANIKIPGPILSNEDFARLQHCALPNFKPVTLPILFPAAAGARGLERAVDQLCQQVTQAIRAGRTFIILSDRGVNAEQAAIPALLAVSAVNHHLIRTGTRTRASLLLESGEPREVHHFALLLGYGASAINPYLAFESLDDLIRQGMLTDIQHPQAVRNYLKAATKGVVKTMAKMGISTIQSYRGAQIFEAIGLNSWVIDKYFTWTASRIEGIGIEELAEEVLRRHRHAFPGRPGPDPTLDTGGQYQWRHDGEHHLFNPETVQKLQLAVRTDNYRVFKEYSTAVNDQSRRLCTLRGLFQFKYAPTPLPLDEVESVESLVRRFKTGAMSYGSISQEAHEALAIAMNRLGGRSNTGEGGEDPARYVREPNGDSKNSAIKQVASGRFGVTSLYLTQARELQIKMAQGAKPGEGGELPGTKVYPWIAKTRGTTPGVGLISPPPHHDIYSIEDLAELIHDLKCANSEARISVKLVAEIGVGTIAAGVAKAHADVVLISGHDGGTGASPLSSIKHAGAPWELGLAETQQTLLLNNLRSRIVVEADGQLKTGRDVVIAALLGAEEFGFATAPLAALGCILMRVCHLNTCPVGIATQDPRLRARFAGAPEHVVNFMRFIAQEVRELMAQLGFRTLMEMVGRTDKLEMRPAVEHWKAQGLDYGRIFHQPALPPDVGRHCQMAQDHGLARTFDRRELWEVCRPAWEHGRPVQVTLPVRNIDRVIGTLIGSEITRRHGAEGLPADTVQLNLHGSAGQSFGAFVPRGLTLTLVGDANDYLGKGLSGGKIIVRPPDAATFAAEENVIIGNVALYGATSGEAYIRGVAGERFAVRNSGAQAVVEGVGDHGCEYMTGGQVVVLGGTGRNFAAGMSGGVAYVFDPAGEFAPRCNRAMVDLESLTDPDEVETVRRLIARHHEYTGSVRARDILAQWAPDRFVKVMPKDYRRALAALQRARAEGLEGEAAVLAAFENNARELALAGGH
ncbi:MAG TPA: glutamate synthase large subunit [Verrucomicrobiota bacterium]|nr:glutamate synthase large subunit [Verrucomicrobiota bacterium]HNT14555.1 glutamate synthase large subunit [Verrucomicrobiota bacterium]